MPTFVTEGPVTKSYVDTTAQGLHVLTPVKAATTAILEGVTYNNGTSDVGATITSDESASISPLDGVTLTGGERVLIKDQSSGAHHGIYTVTTVGSGSVNFVLTRGNDFNTNKNIRIGDFVFCEGGTTNAGHGFVMTGSSNFTSSGGSGDVGTHIITFTQFSGLATTVAVNQGGTGATTAGAAATALGLGTGNSPQFTAIELGHASDTTIARSSAGVVTIEGAEVRTGTVPVNKGGTGATTAGAARTALGVDAAGADNSTNDTLATVSTNYLSLSGQAITAGIVPVSLGGTGATSLRDGGVLLGSGTDTITAMGVLADSHMIVGDGTTAPVAETGATLRTSIGVGTGDDVQFNSLGIGMNATGTEGQIDATGDIIAFSSSDKRLKTNIQPIQDPLTKLQKIGGYTFDWIPNQGIHSHTGNDIGVIAQEIEEVLPEITTTRDNGYKAVRYEKLTAYLIECVKAQQTHIQQLEDRLVKLEKKD